jgi:hypothetical protein
MRRALSWAAWCLVLFWLWLLYNGAWSYDELIAAGCAGAIGATAADVVRRCAMEALRFRAQHLRRVWKPLWDVFPQFGLAVGWALATPFDRRRGTFVEDTARGRAGSDDPVGRAERVFAAYTSTVSANDYAIEIDRERKLALRHVLYRDRLTPLP